MQEKQRRKPFLPLDLQLFAEGSDSGQGGGTDATGGAQGQQGGQGNGRSAGTGQGGTGGDSESQGGEGFKPTPEMEAWLQKQIQSAEDRVRTAYSKQLKQLEQEKETLLKEKMTEEERAKYELQKRESTLLEQERLLKQRTVELEATNLLAAAQLPITFKPFVLGEDVEQTKQRINDFKKLWDAAVSEEVTKRMAAGGRKPPSDGASGKAGFSMNDLIRGALGR
ncbi:hypothetical protein IJ21_17860 [Paenibacillus sp. 32O-W]|uniref:DUF4355 domain-containing protein n=1 Tax=Paenibacillus sp. 32O-W TaxID=1695218 RepID=UPI000722B4B4|nr:DUF4355 domain-containing protein [Paenibacillus sp. 32O-W]ALS27187.1 hypothetical protein IJ21_17860 [Paenibacillus sp. 32O-W]